MVASRGVDGYPVAQSVIAPFRNLVNDVGGMLYTVTGPGLPRRHQCIRFRHVRIQHLVHVVLMAAGVQV